MLRYQDIHQQLNVASWFVDRNLDAGRGDHLPGAGGGTTTYAELAALTNKVGNVLLSSVCSAATARAARAERRRGVRGHLVRRLKSVL